MPKVSVIGAGRVGSTVAQLLAYKGLADVVLVNRTAGTAQGIALDLQESMPVEGKDVRILGTGDYRDTKNSAVIVMTAGMQRKEGMSRDELLLGNAAIVKEGIAQAATHSPKAVIVVVSNPLDAMCSVAWKASGFPAKQVVGMAGVLDSSRFRSFLAAELKVSVARTQAMVLGGHGDAMVPVLSQTTVRGKPVETLLPKELLQQLVERTRNAGAEIIQLEQSSAFYAPGAAIVHMVEAILQNRKTALPCSAYVDGHYGLRGLFLGVPAVLGKGGVERVVEVNLTAAEHQTLRQSALGVHELLRTLRKQRLA